MFLKSTSKLLGAVLLAVVTLFVGACASDEYDVAPEHAAAAPAPASGDGRVHTSLLLPTGLKESSLLHIYRSSPSEVAAGQAYDSDITVTNASNYELDNVVVTDYSPTNYKFTSSTPAATAADGKLRWNLGTFKPSETKTIKLTGTATEIGSVRSCLDATYDPRACLAVNVVQPKLNLTATAPSEVLVCDAIPVHYTVTNAGNGYARNVVVSAPLPKGVTTDAGATSINANVGDLAPGQSKSVDVSLKASEGGKVDTAPGAAADGGLKAAAATSTTVRKPVLTITKTGPARIFIGRSATYEITVTNTGDGDARDTVLEDMLPSGSKVLNATSGATSSAGSLRWNLGTLKPGQVVKANVEVSIDAGPHENKAVARAYCAGAVDAAVKTEVEGIPAILLEVVDLLDPVEVGKDVTYEIVVTNQGSAPATNVVVVATLEDSMKFVSCGGATPGKLDSKSVNFGALPTLAPQAQAKWTVSVTAVKEGDVRFKINMNSDQLKRDVEETEATNFYK